MDKKHILVTGATGYIASRLIPELLELGHRVRCLVRHPLHLKTRSWFPDVEVVQGDVMDPSTLAPAVQGVHTAYYLIHNMSSGQGYTSLENDGAQNFARAAEQAGLAHVIYLGGLADPKGKISYHMRSRIETGESLRQGKTPVTEFRAGVIVGPGSISFEMIRFMTELMPIILGPPWLQNLSQPIAVQNVIDYLLAALENPQGQVFEIGGPDRFTYAELMLTYGRLRGLWRKSVTLPGIPLWFMALGVEWMTPVPASIATPLVDGMQSNSLVQKGTARQRFPDIRLAGYQEAVNSSLDQLHPARLEPVWRGCERPVQMIKHEGFFIDNRCATVTAAPEVVFRNISGLGGKDGWLYANWLWKLRGWIDGFFGGPGMRGRSNSLKTGEVIDFYRIEAYEEHHLLRLRSQLKAPGDGWMEWRIDPGEDGKTKLMQTMFFSPRGLFGFAYWYLLRPIHSLVLHNLIRGIVRRSGACDGN